MHRAIITFAAAVTLAACGTIMHGTTQNVGISSSPSNAVVAIDNIEMGRTPVVTKLSRKDSHIVRITLDGHEPFETAVTRGVSGWVAGNLVFGGLIGLAVDAISGGMYKLTPEQIGTTLNKSVEVLEREGDIYIMVVLRADPSWQSIGDLERL